MLCHSNGIDIPSNYSFFIILFKNELKFKSFKITMNDQILN
jgi:hypothetical protein